VKRLTRPIVLGVVTAMVTTAPLRSRLRKSLVIDTLPLALVVKVFSFGQPLRLAEQVTRTLAPAGRSVTRRLST
jgi:hypothetical protein